MYERLLRVLSNVFAFNKGSIPGVLRLAGRSKSEVMEIMSVQTSTCYDDDHGGVML